MKKSLFRHALSAFVIGLFFIFSQSINAQSALDGFDPNPNGEIHAIVIQPDGKIIIGGGFTTIAPNGGATVARYCIARFNQDGTLDTAFNAGLIHYAIYSIVVQPDGKIVVGGGFTSIGGQARYRIARLTNNTAALSSLSVSRTTVTLTRDGSAAKFTNVVFELSTDNGASWTTLGTAAGSFAPALGTNETGENQFAPPAPEAAGYTLNGLNLPTGQNILVRTRGLFSSGFRNGSQSIEDNVKIAFLPVPTAAQVSVSAEF